MAPARAPASDTAVTTASTALAGSCPSGAQVTNGVSFPPLNWGVYLDEAENLHLKLVVRQPKP